MLIKALLALVVVVFRALLLPFKIITFPSQFGATILVIIGKLAEGAAIINCYVDTTYLSILLSIILSAYALLEGYRLIRWIIKKIPFLSID